MNKANNFFGVFLLFLLGIHAKAMDQGENELNAKSHLTPSNSKDARFQTEPVIIIRDDQNDQDKVVDQIDKLIDPPQIPSIRLNNNRQLMRGQTRSDKAYKRKIIKGNRKSTENPREKNDLLLKNELQLKKEHSDGSKMAIEIPIKYMLTYSRAILLPDSEPRAPKTKQLTWSRSSKEKSLDKTLDDDFNYFDSQKAAFLTGLSTYLRDANIRDNLIYIYPLFLDDASFLKALKSFAIEVNVLSKEKEWKPDNKKWLLVELLNAFAAQGFFLRFPSMAALEELQSLLQKIDGSDGLRRKIWLALDAKHRAANEKTRLARKNRRAIYQELEFLLKKGDRTTKRDLLPPMFLYKKRRIAWSEPKYIAELMTLRESVLFSYVSPREILSWAKTGSDPASILKISETYTKTVNFLALLLICEKNQTSRLSLAEKYVAIGEELDVLHNFLGISQIVSVFKSAEVSRLVRLEQSQVYKNFIALEEKISHLKNYHKYNLELDKLKGAHYIPLLGDIWHEINLIFEHKPKLSSVDITWLGSLGQLLAVVGEWKNLSLVQIALGKETINFMEEVPFVPKDVLEEFSHIIAQYSEPPSAFLPDQKPFVTWSFLELKAFLDEKNLSACIMPFLMNGIWGGKNLLEFLINDEFSPIENNKRDGHKKLLDIGCPEEETKAIVEFSFGQPAVLPL